MCRRGWYVNPCSTLENELVTEESLRWAGGKGYGVCVLRGRRGAQHLIAKLQQGRDNLFPVAVPWRSAVPGLWLPGRSHPCCVREDSKGQCRSARIMLHGQSLPHPGLEWRTKSRAFAAACGFIRGAEWVNSKELQKGS